jgi:hypothetical protein
MKDRGANIDILFRNGLKDYEVLPPPDVWENVRPVVRRKQRPLILLRAAAMVAVVMSLSFLAYRWSMEISSGFYNNGIALNPESEAPVSIVNSPVKMQVKPFDINKTLLSDASLPVIQASSDQVNLPASLSESREMIQQSVTNDVNVNVNNNSYYDKSDIIQTSSYRSNSIDIEEKPVQYLPENLPANSNNRWTIGALVSPTYFTGYNSGNNKAASQLISEEQPLFSYTGGVALSYKINKRFSVQSGLYYSSYGNELTGISSFGGFQKYDDTKGDHNFKLLSASGTIYTNNSDIYLLDNISSDRITTRYTDDVFDPSKANLQYLDNSLRQNFGYLELPVVLKYKIVDKAIDLNIIGGLSSNLLINNSVYTSLNSKKYLVGKTEGLNMIVFSSSLGMGMEYSINNNFSLNLEPTFRYYLNPFGQTTGMNIHPYSFGIFSGLSYKF